MKLKVNHIPIFPCVLTEIKFDNFSEIKKDLISWIYEYKSCNKSVLKSNVGGWQSEANFYKLKTFKKYYDYIIGSIKTSLPYKKRFVMQNMWINVNTPNSKNELHNHPGAVLSGVFWIQSDFYSGQLVFQSPFLYSQDSLYYCKNNNLDNLNYNPFIPFVPTEGTALIFPSELFHYVQPNQSNQDRISISFNMTVNLETEGEP